MPRKLLASLLLLIPALLLPGCGSAASALPSPSSSATRSSDAVAADGAVELAEPALHLTTLASDGTVAHLDLATGTSDTITRIAPAAGVVSDGRYLFAVREGSVTIVDSGAWTWSHGDHFHYYAAPARVVGDVRGPGVPTVVAGERSVGIHFDGGEGDGEAVLVKAAPLADGEIVDPSAAAP